MFLIYDLIFLFISIIYLPIYLFKGKFHKGFLARLGALPAGLKLDRPIWIHAVSVGEAIAVKGLIEELRKSYPDKKFVISTVTPTGNKIAQGFAKKEDFVTYLPLDLSFIVKGVISKINPSIFIIAETEIWPNLIYCLFKNGIPVITINGRISDSSFRGYSMIKLLIRPILKKVSLFCVQSDRDKQRLKFLGVNQSNLKVTGNMKFDAVNYKNKEPADYAEFKKKLGLVDNERLFVAGSTHPGEEEIILKCYKELLLDYQDLKLLIAPRHPERSDEVKQLVSKLGYRAVFVSGLPAECAGHSAKHVFILDTVGELADFYAISDIVFIGGSLVKKGGHNVLEPAFFAKPILFGRHMFNFRDIADLFLNSKAAIMVCDESDLRRRIVELLNNRQEALRMGESARGLISLNQGATKRNSDLIKAIYDSNAYL